MLCTFKVQMYSVCNIQDSGYLDAMNYIYITLERNDIRKQNTISSFKVSDC